MTYGKPYGLLEHGRDPEMLAFAEANWNPYFWVATIPYLGKVLRLFQGLRMALKMLPKRGKPPIPILGVSENDLCCW